MDRAYRATDKVTVHATDKDGPKLDTFAQKPYTAYGFDNYLYKGVMYRGFVRLDNGAAYILLDHPL